MIHFGAAPSTLLEWLKSSSPIKLQDFVLCKLELPTVFEKAAAIAMDMIDEVKPGVLLCICLTGNRAIVTPECIAVNIRDVRIADNEENQPSGEHVIPNGPAANFSTALAEKLAKAIHGIALHAAVSLSSVTIFCTACCTIVTVLVIK